MTFSHRKVVLRIGVAFLAYLGLLYLGTVPADRVGKTYAARHQYTVATMSSVRAVLELFRRDNGFYPATKPGLEMLAAKAVDCGDRCPYLPNVPVDGWGNRYVYISDDERHFSLKSTGADGRVGGEGEDADIDG